MTMAVPVCSAISRARWAARCRATKERRRSASRACSMGLGFTIHSSRAIRVVHPAASLGKNSRAKVVMHAPFCLAMMMRGLFIGGILSCRQCLRNKVAAKALAREPSCFPRDCCRRLCRSGFSMRSGPPRDGIASADARVQFRRRHVAYMTEALGIGEHSGRGSRSSSAQTYAPSSIPMNSCAAAQPASSRRAWRTN